MSARNTKKEKAKKRLCRKKKKFVLRKIFKERVISKMVIHLLFKKKKYKNR